MHLFSVILWLGGLLYQAVILLPVLVTGPPEKAQIVLNQLKAFLPFSWMGLITVLVTGVALMLFNPRFVFLSYDDWWLQALGIKQVAFLAMALFSFGYSRMLSCAIGLGETSASSEGAGFRDRLQQLNRANIFLGIGAVLLSASMN